MEDMILSFIFWVVSKNPTIAALIVFMGTIRLVMKPIVSAIMQIVDMTETKSDNEFVQKIIESKTYKAVTWVLDYVGSIKVPQAPKKE